MQTIQEYPTSQTAWSRPPEARPGAVQRGVSGRPGKINPSIRWPLEARTPTNQPPHSLYHEATPPNEMSFGVRRSQPLPARGREPPLAVAAALALHRQSATYILDAVGVSGDLLVDKCASPTFSEVNPIS